jgi:hypothetical protein
MVAHKVCDICLWKKDIRYKIFNKIYDERVTSTLFILNSSNITYRLDNYWKDQDLLYNYESNLTTGEEIEIDEEH